MQPLRGGLLVKPTPDAFQRYVDEQSRDLDGHLLVDDQTAVVDQHGFDVLPEYSASIPTGQTIGKRWKRKRNYHDAAQGWTMGEYAEFDPPDPKMIKIVWRDLVVIDNA